MITKFHHLSLYGTFLPLSRRWSSNGLTTAVDTSNNMIRCSSTHLTSFAVLVDANGLEGDVSHCANS